MQNLHWRQIPERGSRYGILFLVSVFRLLGSRVFTACLLPVLGFYLLTHRVAHWSSRDYLRRVALRTRRSKPLSVLQHFRSFAISMLERVLAWRGELRVPVDVGEIEAIFAAAEQSGGVIITAHFGNTDLFRGLDLESVKDRLVVLTIRENARRYQQLRGADPGHWFGQYIEATDVTPALGMRLAGEIEQGHFVALAGDRLPSAEGAFFDREFLGTMARFPRGPFVLAATLGCKVYFMACIRDASGYRFRVKSLCDELNGTSNREHRAQALAAAFVDELERQCRLRPYQWYNFFPFWKQTDPE